MWVCIDNSQMSHLKLNFWHALLKEGKSQHKYWKLACPKRACHKSKVLREKTDDFKPEELRTDDFKIGGEETVRLDDNALDDKGSPK